MRAQDGGTKCHFAATAADRGSQAVTQAETASRLAGYSQWTVNLMEAVNGLSSVAELLA